MLSTKRSRHNDRRKSNLYWSAGKPILVGIVTYIGTYYDPILVRPLTNIGRSTSLRKVAFRGRTETA